MIRCIRAKIGLIALVCLAPGCGSNAVAPATPGKTVEAGPNARLKFQDSYKQAIGKNGQLIMKPSMKSPKSVPKS